ncbi:hypothetical protein Q8F55_000881 [Vanrija albida]|uniref:SHSP domain-containing protein n=1 Tax=Vanrija albida TaxID=181172 RepID=A0ABR3QF19_9TREE
MASFMSSTTRDLVTVTGQGAAAAGESYPQPKSSNSIESDDTPMTPPDLHNLDDHYGAAMDTDGAPMDTDGASVPYESHPSNVVASATGVEVNRDSAHDAVGKKLSHGSQDNANTLQDWSRDHAEWIDDGSQPRVTEQPATSTLPRSRGAATACSISTLSPPALYPLPTALPSSGHHHHHHQRTQSLVNTPTTIEHHRASVISSSSSGSGSSNGGGSIKADTPPPPRWAQPPAKMSSYSGRASSFDTGLERPDIDFDPELLEGPAGEWIEVIKGESGRIAIKSTSSVYEVMVWLPGFQLDDITITTRRNQMLHIVADLWDENDHAQWEIKLGDDAIMTSVRANFSGKVLRVTVTRAERFGGGRGGKSALSVRSNNSNVTMASAQAPSFTATMGSHAA